MRALTRLAIPAAAITVLASSTMSFGSGTAGATGLIPLNAVLRNCDFSRVMTALQVPRVNDGGGSVQISSSGSSVTAHVHVIIPSQPGNHYDVGLIQAPMPSTASCGPGAPGTSFTGIDLDATGQADVTIQAPLRQGTTGAWVIVQAGNPHNNAPAEFYTSEFLAPV